MSDRNEKIGLYVGNVFGKGIFGRYKTDMLDKFGYKSSITDFAILLGGYVNSNNFTSEGKNLENRTCNYWFEKIDTYLDSVDTFFDAKYNGFDSNGNMEIYDFDIRSNAIRPQLLYSSICKESNGVRGKSGVFELEYEEYPQKSVDESLNQEIEGVYQSGQLRSTGKDYIIGSISLSEYEFYGKKYVRMVARLYEDSTVLSNGVTVKYGETVWVEVQPIIWLIDEKRSSLQAKEGLVAGLRYLEINDFLQEHFIKDIIPSDIRFMMFKDRTKCKKSLENFDINDNPYCFDFDEVSEEQIINSAIESGVAVFLHGSSLDDKIDIVKQIDPTCEIICLRNASPDSLNDKSYLAPTITKNIEVPFSETVIDPVTLEEKIYHLIGYDEVVVEREHMIDIKPSWLISLEEKCEKEPDRYHVVFFDEITNVLACIQENVSNLVLNREVNEIWKLPENARIVAAGNDNENKVTGNQLTDLLFNKFAHVYIKQTEDNKLCRNSYYEMKNNYRIVNEFLGRGKPKFSYPQMSVETLDTFSSLQDYSHGENIRPMLLPHECRIINCYNTECDENLKLTREYRPILKDDKKL